MPDPCSELTTVAELVPVLQIVGPDRACCSVVGITESSGLVTESSGLATESSGAVAHPAINPQEITTLNKLLMSAPTAAAMPSRSSLQVLHVVYFGDWLIESPGAQRDMPALSPPRRCACSLVPARSACVRHR